MGSREDAKHSSSTRSVILLCHLTGALSRTAGAAPLRLRAFAPSRESIFVDRPARARQFVVLTVQVALTIPGRRAICATIRSRSPASALVGSSAAASSTAASDSVIISISRTG